MQSVVKDLFGEGEQTIETLCSYTEYMCDKYDDVFLQKGLTKIELED